MNCLIYFSPSDYAVYSPESDATILSSPDFGRSEELVVSGLIAAKNEEIGYIPSLPTVRVLNPEGLVVLKVVIEPSFSVLKVDSDLKQVGCYRIILYFLIVKHFLHLSYFHIYFNRKLCVAFF